MQPNSKLFDKVKQDFNITLTFTIIKFLQFIKNTFH